MNRDILARERVYPESSFSENYKWLRRAGIGRYRAFTIAWRRTRQQSAAIRIQRARRLGR